MKRRASILLNLGLVVVAIAAAILVASVCDRVVGAILVHKLWPGPMGFLFQPGTEDHWEMRDYVCSERINSLGFRDVEVPLKKTRTYRIVAIGDSFTYGWGVNLEDAWCKRLERNLRNKGMDLEILNLGQPAAGPHEYAAIAEAVVPVLRPDLVLVAVLAGDDLQQVGPSPDPMRPLRKWFPNLVHLVRYCRHYRVYGSSPQPTKRSAADCRDMYVNVAKDLIEQMSPEQRTRFDRIEEPIKEAFYGGTLNPWLLGHSTGSPDYFMNTLSLDTLGYQVWFTTRAFLRIKKIAQRYGAHVVVLSIPEGFYVNREAWRNVQRIGFHVVPEMLVSSGADEAVQKACEQVGIAFHCVTDAFRKHVNESGLYFELDRHFTPAGNALYADLVTPLLAKEIGNAAKPQVK